MALTPSIPVSQYDITSVNSGGGTVELSMYCLLSVFNIPTEEVDVSALEVVAVTAFNAAPIQIAEYDLCYVYRGRTEDPNLRAWAFWLDSHWFYVLRLPTGVTLLFDLTTEQWHIWGSGDDALWRAFHGTNWLGSGGLPSGYGSNVIVGDDGNGTLYFLDPNNPFDDDALQGADVPRPYLREVTGQISTRGYDMIPCYGVSLMGAIGDIDNTALTAVTLFTSDDEGHNYDEHETINVDPGDYSARVDWNSGLGSFAAPGRLFLVQDHGVLQRIDWLNMADDPDQEK